MSAILNRYLYAPMAALALWAVLLALSPSVAKAQGIDPPKDTQGTERVVVVPGDSLWSISSEQLGPNATPQQIATAVERIYALNRIQIGGDPNLIFAGQKLSLPPIIGEPSTAEASTGATRAREAIQPAEASPPGRAAKSGTNGASRTPVGKADITSGKAPEPVAEPVADPASLPGAAAPAPAPAVRSLASKDSPRSPLESFASSARSAASAAEAAVVGTFPEDNYSRRKLLGLGIMALSVLVGALMAWNLPMRRNTGRSETWGISRGYPGHHTCPHSYDPPGLTRKSASTATGTTPDPAPSSGDVTVVGNDLGRVKLVGIAPRKWHRRRHGRTPIPGRLPRKGLATGAHNPKVRRSLLRAAAKNRSQRSAKDHAKATRREGVGSTRAIPRIPRKRETVEHVHIKPLGLVVGEESRPEPNIHLLSARQRQILQLVAEELPNAQIARRLFITESTVKQHLHKAYKILGVRNRREATKFLGRKDQPERQPVTAVGVRP